MAVVILTNDDGIDAPGIGALQQAIGGRGVIVAPNTQYSGCGHQVTADRPIRIEQRASAAYAIAGTPADCTRIAIGHLFASANIDWVLSGINAGGNLGVDAYMSGTVAAVREAALHGIPAIAISHYRAKGREIDWEIARQRTTRVLAQLQAIPHVPGTFWNVNLPHPEPGDREPDLVFCDPCRAPLPVAFAVTPEGLTYAGRYDRRDRVAGTDVDACFGGHIAITRLSV